MRTTTDKIDVINDTNFIRKTRKFYYQRLYFKPGETPLRLNKTVSRAQDFLKIIIDSGKHKLLSGINLTLKEESNNVLIQDLIQPCNIMLELSVKPHHRFRSCENEFKKYINPFIIAFDAYFNYLRDRKGLSLSIKQGIKNSNKEFYWSAGESVKIERFLCRLFRKAKNTIKIQDNYLDEKILNYFNLLNNKINIFVLTKQLDNRLLEKIKKNRLKNIWIRQNNLCHDRFIDPVPKN